MARPQFLYYHVRIYEKSLQLRGKVSLVLVETKLACPQFLYYHVRIYKKSLQLRGKVSLVLVETDTLNNDIIIERINIFLHYATLNYTLVR
jgi:hypothetical protein